MVLVQRQTSGLIHSGAFSFPGPTESHSKNTVDFVWPMAPHLKARLVKLVMWLLLREGGTVTELGTK